MNRLMILTLAITALMFAATQRASAEPLVALTLSNQLLRFDSATPGTTTSVSITGLQAGESMRGIDYRPANGLLYGFTSSNRLYTINVTTGVATFASTVSVPLDTGSGFGIDFDPVTDRLRVVNFQRNLRIDVDTGSTIVDRPLNPGTPFVTASAYTNNFAGATSTTLYGFNLNGNVLVIQNPPDEGTLTTVGLVTAFVQNSTAFDISGLTGTAYFTTSATIAQPPFTTFNDLWTLNLATGQASLVGRIRSSDVSFLVVGIAAPVGTPVPEPATVLLLGTGLAGIAAKMRRRSKTDERN